MVKNKQTNETRFCVHSNVITSKSCDLIVNSYDKLFPSHFFCCSDSNWFTKIHFQKKWEKERVVEESMTLINKEQSRWWRRQLRWWWWLWWWWLWWWWWRWWRNKKDEQDEKRKSLWGQIIKKLKQVPNRHLLKIGSVIKTIHNLLSIFLLLHYVITFFIVIKVISYFYTTQHLSMTMTKG